MRSIARAVLVTTMMVAGLFVLAEVQPNNPLVRVMSFGAEQVVYAANVVTDKVTSTLGHEVDRRDEYTRASAFGQEGDEFEWSGRIADGDHLEIKGVNGPVFAEYTSGSEVEVRAVKESRRSDVESVHIERVEHAGGVTFCAVYPSRGRKANECAPGDAGRMNVKNNDVKVTFYVRVPAGIDLVAKTVNGKVEIDELESDVRASTVNGSVRVTTTGFAEASTVNGSVKAAMGELGEGLRFSTVNGSIELDLPDRLDADLRASWVNGSLQSDIPEALVGRIGKRSAQGRFGDGGPDLELKTVTGSIRIR